MGDTDAFENILTRGMTYARGASEDIDMRDMSSLPPSVEQYERRWERLLSDTSDEGWLFEEIPWPTAQPIMSASGLDVEAVGNFITHSRMDRAFRDVVAQELRRWHPDKFESRVLPRIHQLDREEARRAMTKLSRILIAFRSLVT